MFTLSRKGAEGVKICLTEWYKNRSRLLQATPVVVVKNQLFLFLKNKGEEHQDPEGVSSEDKP